MPELLLEIFSEEIPARMQVQAAKDLERLVTGALTERGLLFEAARGFAGPRRLTLAVAGLAAKQPDTRDEKKGPRIDANPKAIEGFSKSAGLTLDQCQKKNDGKGEFYVAVIERKGRATAEVLAELLPEQIVKLPWPKSMRWGEGSFRWVRPLHSIVATFDGEVIPFTVADVPSGNVTKGHRFLSSGDIVVRRFEDYEAKLKSAHVILDGAERRESILEAAKQQAFALGLELIPDAGLADEVMGLAEWPVVLIGTIDQAFMDVPGEILQTAMRAHQKYFALRDPKSGKLAPKFVVVANMQAADGGKEIIAGNERVLKARLSDAKFFWDHDRARTLESRVDDLQGIVFHAKLGTQYERVQRIVALAAEIGKALKLSSADIEKAKRAALLCKADLTSGVVGEFPELQGVMGRYYALNDKEDADVANAIRDHYRPMGPKDIVPNAPISMVVALADKLDTLTGFFAINEKPTGSGDPYALRRAALGVIRIALTNGIRLKLLSLLLGPLYFSLVHANMAEQKRIKESADFDVYGKPYKASAALMQLAQDATILGEKIKKAQPAGQQELDILDSLLAFFADRLKVALREKGIRHDLIDAVFALGNEDDLVRLVTRVEALQAFLKTDDGANLLSGYKRAANILKIEEKKDKTEYRGIPTGLRQEEEQQLQVVLTRTKVDAEKALLAEDFAGAMSALARLRIPVDRFFDKVTVNADDKSLRENRLKLLAQIVATAHQVADFSKIEG